MLQLHTRCVMKTGGSIFGNAETDTQQPHAYIFENERPARVFRPGFGEGVFSLLVYCNFVAHQTPPPSGGGGEFPPFFQGGTGGGVFSLPLFFLEGVFCSPLRVLDTGNLEEIPVLGPGVFFRPGAVELDSTRARSWLPSNFYATV